jgi:hypothetical protein
MNNNNNNNNNLYNALNSDYSYEKYYIERNEKPTINSNVIISNTTYNQIREDFQKYNQ